MELINVPKTSLPDFVHIHLAEVMYPVVTRVNLGYSGFCFSDRVTSFDH